MVNGAPGSAWSSLIDAGTAVDERLEGTPADDGIRPLTDRDLFDVASLTKLFVATAALSLCADRLDLDEPVAERVGVGQGSEGASVTLRHLLTHTSGLPAECHRWRDGLRGEALLREALRAPLLTAPGTVHRYSCIGYIAAGRVLEIAAGAPLAEIVHERVLAPLGASATYLPAPGEAVATERQPGRGLVRGEVHDELAAAIGFPVGNAGLFATAHDVAALGRMVLAEGEGAHGRVLERDGVRMLTTVQAAAEGYGQAVGFRVGDENVVGAPDDLGHTGFTGSSLVVSPRVGALAVLLTNRVHPTREGADIRPARRRVARRMHELAASAPAVGA